MVLKYGCLPLVGIALLFSGCARSHKVSVERTEPVSVRDTDPPPTNEAIEPDGIVTLNEAVRFALVNHPALRAYPWALRAASARRLQADLLPNPELEVELEEFGGASDRRRFDGAETSIQLGQLIELGGKRAKRTKLAGIEADLTQSEYESKQHDVMYGVTVAFVEVLAAQEQSALVQELVDLSDKTYKVVEQRVAAGKDSPVEQSKAQVVLAEARLVQARTERQLISARTRLALAWGREAFGFDGVQGDFYRISPVPELHEVSDLISENPDVKWWGTEIRRRHATLEVERTRRVPDVGVRGGVRHFNDTDDNAFVVGLSIPLPAFDRNQGGIEAAGQMLAKTRDDREAAEVDIRTMLAATLEKTAVAFTESSVLRDDVLPAAQSAYDAAEEGYRQGKFNYLDVLDAQRTLFEARMRYVSSLAAYHANRAAVERLIGRPVPQQQSSMATAKPLSEESSDEK